MKIRKVLEISAVAIVGLMASACVADLGKSTADRMLNDTSSSTSTATTGTNSVGRATSKADGGSAMAAGYGAEPRWQRLYKRAEFSE